MAASVKIEFDDGSRVISQTLEEASGAGVTDARVGSSALSADKRPSSCSIDDFYEVVKNTVGWCLSCVATHLSVGMVGWAIHQASID